MKAGMAFGWVRDFAKLDPLNKEDSIAWDNFHSYILHRMVGDSYRVSDMRPATFEEAMAILKRVTKFLETFPIGNTVEGSWTVAEYIANQEGLTLYSDKNRAKWSWPKEK